jgi:protocatechuate 3,4-dioxygenase beta subunit
MKVSSLLLCLCLALAVAAQTSLAGVATGTLEGTVIDSQGKTLPGATVTIQTSDGQHPHATRTDAKGRFEFARFETGQYDLRAYYKGSYSDWAKRVTIRSKKSTPITLRIGGAKVLTGRWPFTGSAALIARSISEY